MDLMRPPDWKDCIQRAKAKPPHAPMAYLEPFQKKIAIPPPAMPAMVEARTNIPRRVWFGGFMAGMTPNLRMRTIHTRDRV
jgi:hypothetical protein